MVLLQTSKDDEAFYWAAYDDFPVWCVAFLNDDIGKPLFPAAWQIEFADKMDQHNYLFTLCTRKCGKSTIMAARLAHYLCGRDKRRIVVMAPTHGQTFVFDKVRMYLKESQFLYEYFLKGTGNDTGDSILTSMGSELINRSVSMSTGGGTIRGEYGDTICVDEVQEIDQSIMDTVVFPMIADAYSKKHLWMIGTPNVYKNPQLENRWNEWREKSRNDPEYSYFEVDCWRAIDEGCMQDKWVRAQQLELPEDDFAMEYLAKFPDNSLRFFPLKLLQEQRRHFYFLEEPRAGFEYFMAVDWAKFNDHTQMVVGELNRKAKTMAYCHWVQIDPRQGIVPYEVQARMAKELYWKFNCDGIAPDATSAQDALVDMLMSESDFKGYGVQGIPAQSFYNYDRDKVLEDQKLGYRASSVGNFEMWRNHKEQMGKGRLLVPSRGPEEDRFAEMWVQQHHELQAKPINNGAYLKLEQQEGAFKDLAVACAMLSFFLEGLDTPPPSMYVA